MTGDENSPALGKKPLGVIPIPDGTFEYDRALADAYQGFSAELLRLSLLGVGATGFLVTKVLRPADNDIEARTRVAVTPQCRMLLIGCLVMFGVAAGAALLHRFLASDSLAFHLRALRLDLRGSAGDHEAANAEKQGRQWRFSWSSVALWASGVMLWTGGDVSRRCVCPGALSERRRAC